MASKRDKFIQNLRNSERLQPPTVPLVNYLPDPTDHIIPPLSERTLKVKLKKSKLTTINEEE